MFDFAKGGCALLIACGLLLGGCAGHNDIETGSLKTQPPSDQRPSDEGVAEGQRYFSHGHYGLSERAFRKAIEANPDSADAWMGLAASYDRLSRFELSERAYKRAARKGGKTATYHNNIGYHYLLRGKLKRARRHFELAANKDPMNPHVVGNLQLLANWKEGDDKALLQQKDLLDGKKPIKEIKSRRKRS